MTGTGQRVFAFGVFELDERDGQLRKHGTRIKLHAQPFQLLLMLLERPLEVVTREEMRQRLWGEDTFVDFDHSLNSAINKIREALNDSASGPRYIETIPGKGYRWIVPVSQVAVAQAAAAAETVPAAEPARAMSVLSTTDDLPAPPRQAVRILLLLVQGLYLGFYLTALANLREVDDLFLEARLPLPSVLMTALITTASVLIPVRLYLAAAVAFDFGRLLSKFTRIFPLLLLLDLVWALCPFLLVHYISAGLALGMSAILVYLPFAQRSLVLMYARRRESTL